MQRIRFPIDHLPPLASPVPPARAALRRCRLVAALAALAALAAMSACAPVTGNLDAMSAVDPAGIGRPVLGLRWKRSLSDRLEEMDPQEFASAAVYLDHLYIGSKAGVFYDLSARDGHTIWKKHLGAMSSRPVVDRGRIYVGTDDGFLYCLDAVSGRERWHYNSHGPILQPPVLGEDLIFFSNESDQVYALDRETGKFRWQHKSEMPDQYTLRGHAGVAMDGDLLFSGTSDGTLIALRAATGTVAWMTSLKADKTRFVDVDATPVVSGGTVYAASAAGGVFALDETTGVIRWRLPIRNVGAIQMDGDILYVAAAGRGIYAIDDGGHVVWRQGTRGGGTGARPIIDGGYLLYTLSDAGLFIANKRTGALYQYFAPGRGISGPPTLAGGRLYVLSNSGILYAMQVRRFDS